MKRKYLKTSGLFLLLAVFALSIFFNTAEYNRDDDSIEILIKVAMAVELSGDPTCNCVDCPEEEFGCWSYDYSDEGCPGSVGYEGSAQCEGNGPGSGKIEKHVLDCGGC